MSIIRENGTKQIKTDVKTITGREFHITNNDQGYYIVDCNGPGDKPDICKQLFTNTREARIALTRYEHENAKVFAKEERIEKIVETLKERDEKKNASRKS